MFTCQAGHSNSSPTNSGFMILSSCKPFDKFKTCWNYPVMLISDWIILQPLLTVNRASDISRGRGSAKFRYFREIPRNSQKNAKYHKIRRKYFQIHVGKTYLILILAIRPVLFTPNVQIYLETSSLQRVNNVPKLPGVLRLMLRKTGH